MIPLSLITQKKFILGIKLELIHPWYKKPKWKVKHFNYLDSSTTNHLKQREETLGCILRFLNPHLIYVDLIRNHTLWKTLYQSCMSLPMFLRADVSWNRAPMESAYSWASFTLTCRLSSRSFLLPTRHITVKSINH